MATLKDSRAATYQLESIPLPRLSIKLPPAFGWLRNLDEQEQAEFYRDLLETVLSVARGGAWSQVTKLLREWKATAEIAPNSELAQNLQQGLRDMRAGRIRPWDEAFKDV